MFDPKVEGACCPTCPEGPLCPQEQPHASNVYTGYSVNNQCTGDTVYATNYVGGKISLIDELKKFDIAKATPIGRHFSQQFRTIAKLRWDMDDIIRQDGSNPYPALKQKTMFLDDETRFDGKRWIWTEENWSEYRMFVAVDVTNANKFILVDEKGVAVKYDSCCKNLFVGDTFAIYANDSAEDFATDCCSLFAQRNITAIDPITTGAYAGGVEITFSGPALSLTGREVTEGNVVYLGDEFKKLWHTRNDCDIIDNCECGEWTRDVRYTNMQHISRCFRFEVSELQRSFASEADAQTYINARIAKPRFEAYKELAYISYLGRGIDAVPGTGGAKGETSGLLNIMKMNQAMNPSLKIISSARSLSDDDKARMFLEKLMMTQNSTIKQSGQTVYAVMDNRALSSILRMHQAFNKYLGVNVFTNDATNKRLEFPEISTPAGKVVLVQDDMFQNITRNSGNVLFVNKDLIKARQRPHLEVDGSNGSFKTVNKGTGVVVKNVTPIGQHECMKFDLLTNIGYQIVGADKAAHAWIQGFC